MKKLFYEECPERHLPKKNFSEEACFQRDMFSKKAPSEEAFSKRHSLKQVRATYVWIDGSWDTALHVLLGCSGNSRMHP